MRHARVTALQLVRVQALLLLLLVLIAALAALTAGTAPAFCTGRRVYVYRDWTPLRASDGKLGKQAGRVRQAMDLVLAAVPMELFRVVTASACTRLVLRPTGHAIGPIPKP